VDDKDRLTADELNNYPKLAEASEKAFRKLYPSGRITKYLHCLFYHHAELQQECEKNERALGTYKQEGWEKMNDTDRMYLERHSTNGAQVGRKRKITAAEISGSPDPSSDSKIQTKASREKIIWDPPIEDEKKDKETTNEKTRKELQGLTIAKLGDLLQERGLPKSGKKLILIMRLRLHYEREKMKEEKKKALREDPLASINDSGTLQTTSTIVFFVCFVVNRKNGPWSLTFSLARCQQNVRKQR
jgi:hypothetical protein